MIRYRGAQVAPGASQVDLDALKSNGANIIRWQMPYLSDDVEGWKNAINYYSNELKNRNVSNVILDIHSPPGGFNGPEAKLFTDSTLKQVLIDKWCELAQTWKDDPKVIAYDLLNEPASGSVPVRNLQNELIHLIRRIDPHKPILYSSPYGAPNRYNISPLSHRNIWYSAHMYFTAAFTGQGVNGAPIGRRFPTETFNKDGLKDYLKSLRRFQLESKARIFITEFGCSNFAEPESRFNWFKACIDIFESYDWNWCYHAFREARVWDVEDTNIWDLLKKQWAKNG